MGIPVVAHPTDSARNFFSLSPAATFCSSDICRGALIERYRLGKYTRIVSSLWVRFTSAPATSAAFKIRRVQYGLDEVIHTRSSSSQMEIISSRSAAVRE